MLVVFFSHMHVLEFLLYFTVKALCCFCTFLRCMVPGHVQLWNVERLVFLMLYDDQDRLCERGGHRFSEKDQLARKYDIPIVCTSVYNW